MRLLYGVSSYEYFSSCGSCGIFSSSNAEVRRPPLRAALRDTLPGSTKIIIAQRVTSVMDADLIIIMDDGRIDGCGTHEELLQTNAIYREVYQSQQEGVSENG